MTKCSEKMIQLILHEYKIFNAQVILRDDYTSEEFIDIVVGRRVYMPCLYVNILRKRKSTIYLFTNCYLGL